MSLLQSQHMQNKQQIARTDKTGLIHIPESVTKADLSSRSIGQKSNLTLENGTSLKKALSETDNFKTELEKTTKISHLFNKNNLIKTSPGGGNAGSGSYKDLVLSVLKKKTKT